MPTNCTGLSPQSLDWCEGRTNLPGIRTDVYYIPKRDISQWPVLPETFVSAMGEMATYVGSFSLAAGKKWLKLWVMVDKSPVTAESQGAKPSKSTLVKATFVHPGTEEDATAFCGLANNDDYVYIVQVKKGKYRVIGNEMYPTETNPSQNLGGSPTDEMGTTLEVSVTDRMPAPFYTGVIATVDGNINEPAAPES
jgi:hypothetical protein